MLYGYRCERAVGPDLNQAISICYKPINIYYIEYKT